MPTDSHLPQMPPCPVKQLSSSCAVGGNGSLQPDFGHYLIIASVPPPSPPALLCTHNSRSSALCCHLSTESFQENSSSERKGDKSTSRFHAQGLASQNTLERTKFDYKSPCFYFVLHFYFLGLKREERRVRNDTSIASLFSSEQHSFSIGRASSSNK